MCKGCRTAMRLSRDGSMKHPRRDGAPRPRTLERGLGHACWVLDSLGVVRRSLMLRVLLPIGVLLIALISATVVGISMKEGAMARAALSAKARLIAGIAGRGSADAIWNLDAAFARASLAALAVDPDYVGSDLTDDHGKVLASDGANAATAGSAAPARHPQSRHPRACHPLAHCPRGR